MERHTSQVFVWGRRPDVICPLLWCEYLSFISIFFNYHILLLKQLMNLLPFPPPRSPTNCPISLAILPFKGRTIRKVIGGVGNFQLGRIFFFAHCLCRNFFFQVNPSAPFFFFRQILLFFEQWNLDSLSMFLCFINYSTLTTDQRIQATLMQNLFENVHTVREEEATWW